MLSVGFIRSRMSLPSKTPVLAINSARGLVTDVI